MLLCPSHIAARCCSILNPATHLLLTGEPHDCLTTVGNFLYGPCSDLLETPIKNSELIFCVNESYLKNETGGYQARYAITNFHSF